MPFQCRDTAEGQARRRREYERQERRLKKKRLGEMLVEAGLLSEEQLKAALAEDAKSGLKLGQYLIRQGIVSEGLIIDMLSRQLDIEKYHPDGFPVDLRLADTIP